MRLRNPQLVLIERITPIRTRHLKWPTLARTTLTSVAQVLLGSTVLSLEPVPIGSFVDAGDWLKGGVGLTGRRVRVAWFARVTVGFAVLWWGFEEDVDVVGLLLGQDHP